MTNISEKKFYKIKIIAVLSVTLLAFGCNSRAEINNVKFQVSGDVRNEMLRTNFSKDEKRGIKKLIKRLETDGIDKRSINTIFKNKEFGFYDIVPERFKKNPEKEADSGKKTYEWYRKHHGIEWKKRDAKDFIERYREELNKAEKKYGVDKRYVVSILGIESDFCKYRGKYKAVNALVTLYVLVDTRQSFAYTQLKEIIAYSSKTGISLYDLSSSYAGAIGCAQFIPSSLNNLFVGKDGIIENTDPFDIIDSIYSISHYLKEFGWDKNQNHKTPVKDTRNWKAIRAYNHSDNYTKLVIEVAESLI
jgi:membrane-bound lytic murein transglycosylase B